MRRGKLRSGNFTAKVATVDGPGDLVTLSNTFNLMTDQIKLHRDQLVYTNEQLDARRRFSEAMLSGVSAGVIGVDPDFRISVVNRSALTLLGKGEAELYANRWSRAFRSLPSCLNSHCRARPVRPKGKSKSRRTAGTATCSCASPPNVQMTPNMATS
jgi:nitrogen fixation/metabolism regulation signal transduction histidine kinase